MTRISRHEQSIGSFTGPGIVNISSPFHQACVLLRGRAPDSLGGEEPGHPAANQATTVLRFVRESRQGERRL